MAVNKRGRRYKLTPRRRAAILKAQRVSARKRRGKALKVGLAVGVTLGVAAGGYAATRRRKSGIISKVPGKELDVIRVMPTGTNWKNVGKTISRTTVVKKKKLPNYVEWEKERVRVQLRDARREKARVRKNDRQRMKYWREKPVGGAPRKTYTSKKRGRR